MENQITGLRVSSTVHRSQDSKLSQMVDLTEKNGANIGGSDRKEKELKQTEDSMRYRAGFPAGSWLIGDLDSGPSLRIGQLWNKGTGKKLQKSLGFSELGQTRTLIQERALSCFNSEATRNLE